MSKYIYLDNNSTTKVDDRVIEVITSSMKDNYANPSSAHQFGIESKRLIDKARNDVSELINSENQEIVFTSGATESINIAIKGIAMGNFTNRKKIVTVSTEHKAVLDTCSYLEQCGFEVVYLPVKKDGLIDENLFSEVVDVNTLLVSVMLVNNETGVIQNIKTLSNISKEKGAYFFCDATQAVGKIEVNVKDLGIDLLCFSGHKFHAPKGIGALFINSESQLKNIIQVVNHGGGQERGIRSGTLNTSGILGLAKACTIAKAEMHENAKNIRQLRDKLEKELLKLEGTYINGKIDQRIYNTTNISFNNHDANVIIGKLKNIALSNGSACTALIVEPSHVLKAMGLSDDQAFSALRFSLSHFNSEKDIDYTISEIKNHLVSSPISFTNN